jgi:2-amino-4-hydroxy-6-hydroxymethyldihydropteridine diphosphokinase
MSNVWISLGTNQGERLENLSRAIKFLEPEVRVVDCSPIYQTEPWGFKDQPDFLNQIIKAETKLAPMELLKKLKSIEHELGRKETFRNGPRIIDLDILYFDKLILDLEDLQIPHPRIPERAFVLIPLADLAPELISPRSGKSVAEMLEAIDPVGVKPYLD